MRTADFDYHLPEELIAQTPLDQRDHSRLMVVDKETGALDHRHFYDLIDYLEPGDCLVLNNTRVIPARLFGEKQSTGGKVELLLLKRNHLTQWETLVKPGKRARIGDVIEFGQGLLTARVVDILEEGTRIIEFSYEGAFEAILDQLGEMPLPPYITEKLEDRERYQTVYSKEQGSAAAPTAGLHFTREMLGKIRNKGIQTAYLTLHVGLGTFRPVKAEDIHQHKMHEEYYEIDEMNADLINSAKDAGKKVIAVGTTCCRTLETIGSEMGRVTAGRGWTSIFIYPGYTFKVVDRLVTNFHLPQSTLVMLVSALAGRAAVLHAYETAVEEKYRFFSFGDSMLIK